MGKDRHTTRPLEYFQRAKEMKTILVGGRGREPDCRKFGPQAACLPALISQKSGWQYGVQWFSYCRTPQELPTWQAICNRPRCEAACLILARDTLNLLLLHCAIHLIAKFGQSLKRQRCPCGSLTFTSTTCYPCAVSTWKSECLLIRMIFCTLFLKICCTKFRWISGFTALKFAVFSFVTSSIPRDRLLINDLASYAWDLGPKVGCNFPHYLLN
jgi:hypothetical protein